MNFLSNFVWCDHLLSVLLVQPFGLLFTVPRFSLFSLPRLVYSVLIQLNFQISSDSLSVETTAAAEVFRTRSQLAKIDLISC